MNLITGFREISKKILKEKEKTFDIYYVKPFPPGLYDNLFKNPLKMQYPITNMNFDDHYILRPIHIYN